MFAFIFSSFIIELLLRKAFMFTVAVTRCFHLTSQYYLAKDQATHADVLLA